MLLWEDGQQRPDEARGTGTAGDPDAAAESDGDVEPDALAQFAPAGRPRQR